MITASIYINKIKILIIEWISNRTKGNRVVKALILRVRNDVSPNKQTRTFLFSINAVSGSLPAQHIPFKGKLRSV
jgi:hypothetical protein